MPKTIDKNTRKIKDYKHRNKQKVQAVLATGVWSEQEIDTALRAILCDKCESLNQILADLDGKSLDDLIKLVVDDLGVRGNAHIRIDTACDVCGKRMLVTAARYRKGHIYCSMECRNQGFTNYKSHAGANNGRYNSVEEHCTECGKTITVPLYRQKHTNRYGDHHVFCSHECYSKYRTRYYVEDKSIMTHYVFSDEQRDKARQSLLKRIHNGEMPQTLTQPHMITNRLLDDIGITDYKNEYLLKYYSVDIYLPSHGLFIEVMGDYWHGLPLKYDSDDLSEIQRKSVRRDKSKHTYVKKYHNIEVLYLWESDLIHRPDVCKCLIQSYLANHGVLLDYQSYNYMMVDGLLALKQETIFPYFIAKNA